MKQNHKARITDFFLFLKYVGQRFMHDRMQPRAASLTFTSLLAMVPLLAISFAIFAAFPAFENLKAEATNYIFENFVPQVGEAVKGHLDNFTAKAQGGLSAVGIIFLGVTSIMLLLTISGTFNEIWRARQPRSLIARLLVFWAILTLGPLFFGANISLSSALFAYARTSGLDELTGSFQLALLMPFIVQTLGITIMFLLIPNYPVRKRDALLGGLVAAILLESLKKLFAFYVTSFPTYETIYGAMATIPIFLLWIYLSWIVILFSAQFTASLPEWRAGSRRLSKEGISLTERLSATLSLLHALQRATKNGLGLTERQLPVHTGMGPERLVYALKKLEDLHFVSKADTGHWHLCRELKGYKVCQFIQDLRLTMDEEVSRQYLGEAWSHRLQELLGHSRQELEHTFENDLLTLLEDMRDEEEFPLTQYKGRHLQNDEVAGPPLFITKVLALIGIGVSNS